MDTLMNSSLADFKRRCIGWKLKFVLWPKRCYFSGKLLWLRFAYQGTSILTGQDLDFEFMWVERKEWLFQRIKGSI